MSCKRLFAKVDKLAVSMPVAENGQLFRPSWDSSALCSEDM